MSKRDVYELFHPHGRLAQISLKSAYGFVQYHTTAEAQSAMNGLQGAEVKGRKISKSRPREVVRARSNHYQISRFQEPKRLRRTASTRHLSAEIVATAGNVASGVVETEIDTMEDGGVTTTSAAHGRPLQDVTTATVDARNPITETEANTTAPTASAHAHLKTNAEPTLIDAGARVHTDAAARNSLPVISSESLAATAVTSLMCRFL